MFLNFKLNFQEYFENMLVKLNLYYGNTIYNQGYKAAFQQKLESIQ